MATEPQQINIVDDQPLLAFDSLQADDQERGQPRVPAYQGPVQQTPAQQVPYAQQGVPLQEWPQGQPNYYYQAPLTNVAQDPVQYAAVSYF